MPRRPGPFRACARSFRFPPESPSSRTTSGRRSSGGRPSRSTGISGAGGLAPHADAMARRLSRDGRQRRASKRPAAGDVERGPRIRRDARRGRVRVSVPRPRDDGAHELRRAARRRLLRDLDGDPVPDRRPGARREDCGAQARAGPAAHDVSRRRASAAAPRRRATSWPRPYTWPKRPVCRSRSSGRARTTCGAGTTARCGRTKSPSGSGRTACPPLGDNRSWVSRSSRARRSR